MRLRTLSYRVVLPVLAIVSLAGFWRINKVNFFHHFIRVIAEVEERNSHELPDAKLAVLTFDQQVATPVAYPAFLPSEVSIAEDSPALSRHEDRVRSNRGFTRHSPIRGP
ncbi:MAG: hypothetical protein NWR72_21400 [Bacteroidia bacterium]|nr:hypothetical protein [Bacteroidia bacterium]